MRQPLVRLPFICAVLALTALANARPAVADYDTYLALGDSIAFGETDFLHNPSDGNRGYVSEFARYQARFHGGVIPNVVNLGVDGETTSTFFQYSGPTNGGEPGMPAYDWNTNYKGLSSPTQHQAMDNVITASKAAGETIGAVTIQLGANDLFVLASDPAFFAKTPADQIAAVGSLLKNTVAPNLGALVTELETRLPGVSISLLGYYNPYTPFLDSSDPALNALAHASGPAIAALNQTIAAVAQQTGVRYVDIAPLFQGDAALRARTYVLDPVPPYLSGPDIHPKQAGYDAITRQLQAIPEPSSLVLVALGTAASLVGLRRKRRAEG